MSGEREDPLIAYLMRQFTRAAIVAHYGYEDEDDAMQCAGIDSAKRAIKGLDLLGSKGRLALVPLLDDPDWGIRVFAAGYLVKIMPERALAVLKEIDERCPTRAHMTAFRILWSHEHGDLNS
ncbi:MAG: HEAT repeat domain-containing protein [Methylocystis sp.]